MKTKLLLFLIAFPLMFIACEKNDGFIDETLSLENTAGKKSVAFCDFEDVEKTVQLIAGQHNVVGDVTVSFDAENMYVAYSTSGGWHITETHLHIGSSSTNFPLVGQGNPQIGQFNFNGKHNDGDITTYKIPLGDLPDPSGECCYYIAAHAVVSTGDQTLESLINLEITTASVNSTPKPSDQAYFSNIIVSDAGFLNGTYTGWCLEPDKPFRIGQYNVYSSIGVLPEGYPDYFFNRVNWILNQRFVGKTSAWGELTSDDVQIAIWVLKLGKTNFADALPLIDSKALDPAYGFIKVINEDRINYIVGQALAKGKNFYPKCGDVFAIIFTRDSQDFIIEYPIPCDGTETAWGAGTRFTQRGSWAMYFKICADE